MSAPPAITGTIFFHRDGSAHVDSQKDGEFFIPPHGVETALPGDVVQIEPLGRGRARASGRSPEARVVGIIRRKQSRVVGELRHIQGDYYVVADDPKFDVHVLVQLGDCTSQRKPKLGEKVVAELDPWRDRRRDLTGRITEVLGRDGEKGVGLSVLIHRYDLPVEFPDDVMAEAESFPAEITEDEIARRKDCRDQLVVTIDPDDARDHDDASFVEPRADGGWRLSVHIADVSHYVLPNSRLDKEARKRGNSTYLPECVIPMLPERLSNNLCSLRGGVERLAFSAFMEFDATGKPGRATFARSIIRSRAKLTYRQALAILQGGEVEGFGPEISAQVRTAWELASVLRKRRFEAGSLDLEFPEVKVWLDENGNAERIERLENDISHQLIEEFMLAANEAVAREVKIKQIPAPYRIHENPDPARLEEFQVQAKIAGLHTSDLTNRREVLKMLSTLKKRPDGIALRYAFLKSLKRAAYDPLPLGHYGLAKTNYAHFTSPIRRYADLLLHRALARVLAAGRKTTRAELVPSPAELREICEHISRTERTSAEAEREGQLGKKLEFFERQLANRNPQEFRALVTDIKRGVLIVELPDLMLTGSVAIALLTGRELRVDIDKKLITDRRSDRRWQIGTELNVIVAAVDRQQRRIEFAPIETLD